jgi:glyoxylase-like metal-dependent hydrolase (beta-lactamase superfamily II)
VIFRQLLDRETSTLSYLVAHEATREAALVDPVLEQVDRDLGLVAELGLTLVAIVETHVHADHVTGAGELRRRTGARTAVPREGGAPCADVPLAPGDVVRLGGIELRALATPGHTEGCFSYAVAADGQVDRLLTGDALLIRGCGRTDFQGGSADRLFTSVRDVLFAFPDETLVYPAHDYRGFSVSTIGEEKRHNPRLGLAKSRADFVAMMAALHLPPPAKIGVAVPANRACGEGPATSPRQG